MTQVTVDVPATTANLGPGFDCVGLALGLRNRLVAEVCDRPGWSITIEGIGAAELPRDESNLVAEAMRQVLDRVADRPAGFRLHQVNRIPLCSGLGSSAAAIVAGLVAANELCGGPLTTAEMALIAAQMEGHPDNTTPAFLGGWVVAVILADRLEYVRFDPPAGMTAVVGSPAQQLETIAMRAALPAGYSREDTVFNIGRAALLVAALASGERSALAAAMTDRVHQPYRLSLIPGAAEVLDAAGEAGALGTVLSGSGPTLLALCDGQAEPVMAAMRNIWAAHHVAAEVRLLPIDAAGVRVTRS